MHLLRKYSKIFLAVLMGCLLAVTNIPVNAEDGGASITLLFGKVDMVGAQFGLYKVADVELGSKGEKYVQTDKFKDYEFNFDSFLPEPNASLNQQVEEYVAKNKIKADEVQTVPANKDRLPFTNLSRGLYFIRLLNKSANTPEATMNSFLISLPQQDPNLEGKEYWHVTSESKMTLTTPDPGKGDPDPTPNPQSPISNSSSNKTTTTTSTSSDKISKSSSSKTGQQTNLWLYLGMGLAAMIILWFLISRLRRAR